jgi:hypothetical protein
MHAGERSLICIYGEGSFFFFLDVSGVDSRQLEVCIRVCSNVLFPPTTNTPTCIPMNVSMTRVHRAVTGIKIQFFRGGTYGKNLLIYKENKIYPGSCVALGSAPKY